MMTAFVRALEHAFRRAATPLLWYYGVTIGLPLANGAAGGAGFGEHTLFVALVPVGIVVVACAARELARISIAACSSVFLPRSGSSRHLR